MPIRWDFHRAARALVAAQAEGKTSSSRNDDNRDESPSLMELNHWAVERRYGGINNAEVESDARLENEEAVYLLHPPIVMTCKNDATSPRTPMLVDYYEEGNTEEEAEECHVEMMDEASPDNFNGSTTSISPSHSDREYECAEWTFSIVFHETWRVPTLYFACSRSDGTPLARKRVLDILLSHRVDANGGHDIGTGDGRNEEEEEDLWEFVSQEEHPATGEPSYFLHPCRTAERMEAMALGGGRDFVACPLLSWMSMILPAVGCKMPPEVFCRIRETIAGKE